MMVFIDHWPKTQMAVPEKLKSKVLELCSVVENADELPPIKYAVRCGELINEVNNLLDSVPRDSSVEAEVMDWESTYWQLW